MPCIEAVTIYVPIAVYGNAFSIPLPTLLLQKVKNVVLLFESVNFFLTLKGVSMFSYV